MGIYSGAMIASLNRLPLGVHEQGGLDAAQFKGVKSKGVKSALDP
jgi:hypothetical protein